MLYKQVPLVDHQLFNKWRKLDGSAHCDCVVAYLEAEDDNFGYIVKEYFEMVCFISVLFLSNH